jgi:hypothetical protein
MNDSINSNAPTFDIGSLPSVHEHDWRDRSFIDENKTAATFTLEADVRTVEDPYSDLYRARESEGQTVEKQQHIKRQESHNSQPYQPSVQPTARTMNNGQQQRVTFEAANSATEQEVVHINAMFQPPPSTNNTGNSAQGPSDPSNYYGEQAYHSNNGYLSNNHPQMQIPQGYVPNKYSAHYDPNMPDWEGVTIAERTMADISTVTPPPDDYYNPYAPPPVAMVAAAAPGATWEELEETDAERADWRNPKYGSDEKSEPSGFSAEQSALGAKDRRLLWGLMCLVGLLVVVVAVVVPVSLNFAKNASQIQSNEATAPVGGSGVTSPSLSPSILNESASTKPGETCANPPCDEPPVQPSTVVPATDDNTDSDGPAEPATTEPNSDGRDTDEPTPSPVTDEPTPSPVTDEPTKAPLNTFFCGETYDTALEKCFTATHCPSGAGCPEDQACFDIAAECTAPVPTEAPSVPAPGVTAAPVVPAAITATPSASPVTASPSGSHVINTSFCGVDYTDASENCSAERECPTGFECPSGETCFAGITCAAMGGGS